MKMYYQLRKKEEKKALWLNIIAWSVFVLLVVATYIVLSELIGDYNIAILNNH